AKDLQANKGASLVVAGYGQPIAVHLLVHAINAALGNVGKTVVLHEVPETKEGNIVDFAKAQFDTLVIVGANPVYNAPADLDIKKALSAAKTIVRLGYYEDETFEATKSVAWHLPLAHYLESWGDALTSDGTMVPVQPLIQPLFAGLTELEFLARIGGLDKTSPHDIVQETFADVGGKDEVAWRRFLYNGYLENSAAKHSNGSPRGNAPAAAKSA